MEGFDKGWNIKKIPLKTQGTQLSQVNQWGFFGNFTDCKFLWEFSTLKHNIMSRRSCIVI